MDEHGVIIASGEPSRLRQRHERAILALKENRIGQIDSATANQLKGVRSAFNLPILFAERLIGVVGITGEPEIDSLAYAELWLKWRRAGGEHMVLIEQRQWDKRYREELINQLILRENSTESLRSMAAYLGSIDLLGSTGGADCELSQPDREALRSMIVIFENHARNHLVTFTEFNELIIIKPITLKRESGIPPRKWGIADFKSWAASSGFSRILVKGYFAGETGLHRLCSGRPRRRWRKRQKAAQPVYFYHDHALPRC